MFVNDGTPALAIELLLAAPRQVRRALSIVLLLERALRDDRDLQRAHSVLMSARADHPASPAILFRLSDLYRDDGRLERAYEMLLAAESLGRSDPVRRLVFETAMKNRPAGEESLRALMALRSVHLLRATYAVNAFGSRYPALAPEIARFRAMARQFVQTDGSGLSPSDRVRLAISCRMIDDARRVHDDAVANGLSLRGRTKSLYEAVKEPAESVSALARLAWENECGDGRRFAAIVDGRVAAIDPDACDPAKLVEVFVPPAFYDQTAPVIVRKAFPVFVDRIAEKRGVVLVPRHQFSFRDCRPLLRGKSLSYHTRGAADVRHLRYKDGALLGYMTLDHAGYAGFASIATDFDEIRCAVADARREALHQNRSALYAELVEQGKSKLPQPAMVADIAGRYVFVALQVANDEVAELAWMSQIDLLNHVARFYRGTGIAVVVKRHPRCRSFTIQATLAELGSKGMIIASAASIHSLISGAEMVFTANSGVGLEALIHGRPVIVSGLCDYAYGATCVRSAAELEAAIAKDDRDDLKGLEFLYYYTQRHAFRLSDKDGIEARLDEWLDRPLAPDPPPERGPQART